MQQHLVKRGLWRSWRRSKRPACRIQVRVNKCSTQCKLTVRITCVQLRKHLHCTLVEGDRLFLFVFLKKSGECMGCASGLEGPCIYNYVQFVFRLATDGWSLHFKMWWVLGRAAWACLLIASQWLERPFLSPRPNRCCVELFVCRCVLAGDVPSAQAGRGAATRYD
jgi:hypothetical protein